MGSLRTPGDCMLTITTLCPSFNSLFQTNFPTCRDGWQITVVWRCSDVCKSASPQYRRWHSTGDRRGSFDIAGCPEDCAGRAARKLEWGTIAGGESRPDPHPWPAPPPAERAARLPAVAPDKLISRDAGGGVARPMGGGYKGQWLGADCSLLLASSCLLPTLAPDTASSQKHTHVPTKLLHTLDSFKFNFIPRPLFNIRDTADSDSDMKSFDGSSLGAIFRGHGVRG